MSRRHDLECDDGGWLMLLTYCDGDYEDMRVLGPIGEVEHRVPSGLGRRYEEVLAEWRDRLDVRAEVEADYRRAKLWTSP